MEMDLKPGCKTLTKIYAKVGRTGSRKTFYKQLPLPRSHLLHGQAILKEINPEYSLEGLMLKLKLQYFGHLIWRFIGKDPDAGKDWRQEKGTTEDEMVGWHHRHKGHEFEQTPGGGEGQGSQVSCSPQGRTESDMPEQLNGRAASSAWSRLPHRPSSQVGASTPRSSSFICFLRRVSHNCMTARPRLKAVLEPQPQAFQPLRHVRSLEWMPSDPIHRIWYRNQDLTSCVEVKWREVAQSCLTLCDPMDYSLQGSSVHGILQARVLEWVAISFSRGSSRPRDRTRVSLIAGRCFTVWATRETLVWKRDHNVWEGTLNWGFSPLFRGHKFMSLLSWFEMETVLQKFMDHF